MTWTKALTTTGSKRVPDPAMIRCSAWGGRISCSPVSGSGATIAS